MNDKPRALGQFPVDIISDETRRKEFLHDEARLIDRIGYNAMSNTFNFYLHEQAMEKAGVLEQGPKGITRFRVVGQKNTAEILARFVETGWMEYFLSGDSDFSKQTSISTHGKMVLIGQHDGGMPYETTQVLIKKPNERLSNFADRYLDEAVSKATLIAPEDIRRVFAKIDARYE